MAVVLASAAFWAPVSYKLVGDDGEPSIVSFRARYKRLKTTERKELDRRLAAGRLRLCRHLAGRRSPNPSVEMPS